MPRRKKAKEYPNIKFAIIDNAYFPTKDSPSCDDTVKDCYADGGLTNVTSLMFQEDEVGYLAGVLAACMSKSGVIGSVAGMEIPPVVRFVTGYQTGAKSVNPDVKTLNQYIPSFTDPAKGKEVGLAMLAQKADVIFGVGGNTGNGGLTAAKEKGAMGIGVDVDQYLTFPDVKDILITECGQERRRGGLQCAQGPGRRQLEGRHADGQHSRTAASAWPRTMTGTARSRRSARTRSPRRPRASRLAPSRPATARLLLRLRRRH